MRHPARSGPLRLLVLLAVLQAGCLAESDPVKVEPDPVEVLGKCGPRELTPECCLKENPGQWERCTGSSEAEWEAEKAARSHSLGAKAAAAATAGVLAVQPLIINAAEQRGAELSADVLAKVEKAILQCVRKADKEVNDYHFNGKSPSWDICQQVKVGDQTTWAAYLGLFKHEQAWPCLREALDKLMPGRYRLHPRFRLNERTGEWEFLEESTVREIVASQGWKGLKGTIEPDVILQDEKGFIVRVYDLKFPCPETNGAQWSRYTKGPWTYSTQKDVYKGALKVTPLLVSPREGVELTQQ
ncbi:MAG: hypothetical protein ACXU86_18370 [Archangium sp.]